VVVENIYTHIARGEPRRQAVARAVSEITVPIIGSTITPVVVFLPLTLLTGVTGVFFRSLALTMAVALLTSLVLALTFTPVLAQRFVKAKPSGDWTVSTADDIGHGRLLGAVILRYESLLRIALDRRWLVAVSILGAVVGSYFFFSG